MSSKLQKWEVYGIEGSASTKNDHISPGDFFGCIVECVQGEQFDTEPYALSWATQTLAHEANTGVTTREQRDAAEAELRDCGSLRAFVERCAERMSDLEKDEAFNLLNSVALVIVMDLATVAPQNAGAATTRRSALEAAAA